MVRLLLSCFFLDILVFGFEYQRSHFLNDFLKRIRNYQEVETSAVTGERQCSKKLLLHPLFLFAATKLPTNSKGKKTTVSCVDPEHDSSLTTSGYYDPVRNVIVLNNKKSVLIMADTALFEVGNAESANEYLELDRELRNNTLAVVEYGRSKATVESDVTYNYVIRVRKFYHDDLTKATEQARKADAYIKKFKSKEAYREAFINSPHSIDPNAAFPATLPSGEMYVYEALVNWRGAKVYKRFLYGLTSRMQKKLAREEVWPLTVTFKDWLWNNYCDSKEHDRLVAYWQVIDAVKDNAMRWGRIGLNVRQLKRNIKRLNIPKILNNIAQHSSNYCSKYKVPDEICNSHGILPQESEEIIA